MAMQTAPRADVRESLDRASSWILPYAVVVGAGLFVGLVAFKRSEQTWFGVCLALLLALLVGWARFPRAVLAATMFLTLVGDLVTVSWFPFTKNLSSQESIFYVADGVTITPLEIIAVTGLVVTSFQQYAATGRLWPRTALIVPLGVFLLTCLFGLALGLTRGGDSRIAIFEIRPLLYLPILYLLVVNVCNRHRDYRRLLVVAIAAIVVQSMLSLRFLLTIPKVVRDDLESLVEHGSAISMNLVFVAAILAAITPGIRRRHVVALTVACIPVIWVYLVSERRAAVVALGAGLIIVAVMMWWGMRRLFWIVVPISTLFIAAYVLAFWNSDSSIGFAAQAIKGVIAPEQLGAEDQSSDIYRQIENFDLWATIRVEPLLGQGFGRPFLRPIPLPDISVFEFHEYIPHNSLLYVWIKTGFVGFVTLLFTIARSLSVGVDRLRRLPPGPDSVVAGSLLIFIVMYSLFLYVDIAWEPRNVILLAVALGLATGPGASDSTDDESDEATSALDVDDESVESAGDRRAGAVVLV